MSSKKKGNPSIKGVLIVDDDASMLRAIQRSLKQQPWSIRTASNAQTAIAELHREPPDLVVTDVVLGDGSGLDVAHAAAELCPAPLVIAMTAATF